MQYGALIKTLIVLAAVAFLREARAESSPQEAASTRLPEVRIGLLAHDVGGLWSGTHKEGGLDVNAEVLLRRPHLQLLGGEVRPNLGATVNTGGNTSRLYAGFVWERALASRFFIGLGLGLALHDGELESAASDRKQLGSRVLFRIPVEIGYRPGPRQRISAMFMHMSNAYLAEPNEGMDAVGIRYGYSF